MTIQFGEYSRGAKVAKSGILECVDLSALWSARLVSPFESGDESPHSTERLSCSAGHQRFPPKLFLNDSMMYTCRLPVTPHEASAIEKVNPTRDECDHPRRFA